MSYGGSGSMKGEYDAIVVGAGPSGSFCAKTMAENGLDVLIVEKKQEIGTPLRCAEGVGKGAFIELLGEIDEKWIAMEIEGAEIYAPDGTKITMGEEHSGNEVGYVLERKIFDRFLAEEAVRAGAELMVKTRATGLLMDGRRVRGVRLSRRGESFEVESSLVIGADGVESLVGRWAGINTALKPNDIESCAQYLVKGIDVKPYCEFYLGKSIAPGGYAWVFPKGDNMANVGLGVLGKYAGERKPIEYLNDFIEFRCPEAKIVELHVGAVPVAMPVKPMVSDGLMLIGDAAHLADPITGGGILNGLDSGRIAGRVAVEAIKRGDFSAGFLRRYEKEFMERHGKSFERNYFIKEKFIEMSDEQISEIFRALKDVNIEDLSVFGLVKEMFKKNPKILFELRKYLF